MYLVRFADSKKVIARRKTEAAALREALHRGHQERLHKDAEHIAIEALPETAHRPEVER